MPLRDLPTESQAAAALIRTESLTHRKTLRRTGKPGLALSCLAAGALLAVLVPGQTGTGCYLWRATSQPVGGRTAALALPVAIVLLILADRLSAESFSLRRQVRGWGTAVLVVVTMVAWTGFVQQGRPSCSFSPAVIGTLVCGTLATTVAGYWATQLIRPPMTPEPTPGDDSPNASAEPLNQSELRALFVRMIDRTENLAPIRVRLMPFATGTLAVLVLLSTVLPWRELRDPVSVSLADAGLIRVQLWEVPSARSWALIFGALAVATLATRGLVRRLAAVACGSATVAGLAAQLLWLPPLLPNGVGYRPALGAWTALALGVLLIVAGLIGGRLIILLGAAGAVVGLLVPSATSSPYRPETTAGVPHRLLDLRGGQLLDRLGMRVAIGTSDPLDSYASALDGSPGQWLLGRTGSESSTVFAYDDGVALPQVTLNHGATAPALWGVADNHLVLLAGGAGGKPWAILSVPLDLSQADISLSHKDPDGKYYVTPGVEVLASGVGPGLSHRNADRSIVLWGAATTWQFPANQLRPGMRLQDFQVNPGAGAPGNAVSSGPDGTTVWRTSETGLAMARRGGPVLQLTGVAPAGCLLSSDAASSSMTVDAFAVDVRGNVWLGGGAPTSVITPDGVLRKLPGGADGISSIEARPDGSVLLGTSPGGGSQILQIPDAAASASTYPAAPDPLPQCDRRKPVHGTTDFQATVLPPVETVDPGQGAPGVSSQLGLDASGKLAHIRLPLAARSWAPDGQGGVWWTLADQPGPERAVHLVRGRATAQRDLQPLPDNPKAEFAAAAGDRLVTAIGGGLYNFYEPGGVRRTAVKGDLRPDQIAQLLVTGRLLDDTVGMWFAGPDGKLWGYDALHLLRFDAGRISVVAGPTQGVPQAADEVTVIGQALYFRLGNDLVVLR
ncbi:hypothetical protein E1263_01745 [Kribbella antibiotica]|uniref:Uncharacterized protein n=1 Tax=Kribbella antibiotica TaxID=190195 RepID=A0A4R4ZXG1_9ACTN|nr:hypothetical protein [Kribbella antibiotica]TDD63056.1 hypothetical protein E1263_01745 [Kribbella antibiotica]